MSNGCLITSGGIQINQSASICLILKAKFGDNPLGEEFQYKLDFSYELFLNVMNVDSWLLICIRINIFAFYQTLSAVKSVGAAKFIEVSILN